jgi:folylpolyglutamate synthase/dihydropteroate synthase
MPVATMHTASSNQQGIDLSLVRITELLKRLSLPQTKYPVIHVAGTNSKGSTIAYLSSILNKYIGITTASFTSPHLRIERDCCKVGSQIIDEVIWEEAGKRVQDADEATIPASSSVLPLNSTLFEKLTARCFVAFDLLPPSRRPEVLLIEVGMGGAKDATNVFSPSQVLASVICPIDYDHQSFLGNTLEEIAGQKVGIVKQGGLCIMADQRRQRDSIEDDQVECAKVRAIDTRSLSEGSEAAEIEETIRRNCVSLQARLVKAYVPWRALNSESSFIEENAQSPWSARVETHVRYTPVLLESSNRPGDYISSTGDPVVPGPTIWLPRTRAALTGCHLALQTLWSIARDETPCALGKAGSDINEELRLRIAFALRDDRFAQQELGNCIEQTRISGRAEWIEITLPSFSEQANAEGMEMEGQSSISSSLHALVDGAHNSSAASALRQYFDTCLQHRISSSKQQQQHSISHITVTWILAFSQGKDIADIVRNLFNSEQGVDNVTNRLAASGLDTRIEHKVACLQFTTPVEGMPWVSSVPADQVAEVITSQARSVVEVQTFEALQQALQQALIWAFSQGDGKSIIEGRTNLVIIAGSLYLVSDVHRLLSSL